MWLERFSPNEGPWVPVPAPNERPKIVLVTGATGFIGRKLVYRLIERGERVLVLARNPEKAARLFGAHVRVTAALDSLSRDERIDAIVNLAGEPIAARRWTARRKRKLVESRVAVTNELLALVERLERKPQTWINASAIGFYGVQAGDEPLHEKSPYRDAFQSALCRRWEEAARGAERHDVKVTMLRIGVVLGRDGGALPALARPVRFGLGAVLGTGKQWTSWIHVDDLVALFLFVLDEATLAGPFNATAPTPVRHAQLMAALARTLRRRLLPLAVPEKVLRVALGELAELIVDGQRVAPTRALALGFRFRHPTIDGALAYVFGQTSSSDTSPDDAERQSLHQPSGKVTP